MCIFCDELTTKCSYVLNMLSGYGIKSRVIDQSSLSVVIVGLGAIEPGYVLILPHRHCFCIGDLTDEELSDFIKLKKRAVSRITEIYGPPVFFEHGAVSDKVSAGACAEHAHLHVLPNNNIDFRSELKQNFVEQNLQNMSDLRELANSNTPYLYFEDSTGSKWAYLLDRPIPSQYMRRIWARSIGRSNEYDWALFPEKINMLDTIKALTNGINSSGEEMCSLAPIACQG